MACQLRPELKNLEVRYAIIDIEAIALGKWRSIPLKGRYARQHNCRRKVSILCFNGATMDLETRPCVMKADLDREEWRQFRHCQREVHLLPFLPVPPEAYPRCIEVRRLVKEFLVENRIEKVFHKGGDLERDLAVEIGFESVDIAWYGVR